MSDDGSFGGRLFILPDVAKRWKVLENSSNLAAGLCQFMAVTSSSCSFLMVCGAPLGDGKRFAGPNLVPSTVQEHIRRAGHHPVGLLLPRMDVDRRTTAVGPHGALYLDELAGGIGGGLRDDELQPDLGRELEHVLRWDRLDAYPFVASSRRPTGRGFAFVEHGPSLLSLASLQSLYDSVK